MLTRSAKQSTAVRCCTYCLLMAQHTLQVFVFQHKTKRIHQPLKHWRPVRKFSPFENESAHDMRSYVDSRRNLSHLCHGWNKIALVAWQRSVAVPLASQISSRRQPIASRSMRLVFACTQPQPRIYRWSRCIGQCVLSHMLAAAATMRHLWRRHGELWDGPLFLLRYRRLCSALAAVRVQHRVQIIASNCEGSDLWSIQLLVATRREFHASLRTVQSQPSVY